MELRAEERMDGDRRVYGRPSAGDHLLQLQARLPPSDGTLVFSTWADASATTIGGRPFLPLLARFDLAPRSMVFKRGAVIRLGHIALPGPTSLNSRRLRLLTAQLLHKSLEVILQPLRDLESSGLHLVDPASGDVRTLQVVRLYHSADIQGYGAQLLVRAHKDAAFPAPGRKVPAAKLADPDAAGAYPRFSEAGVAEVVAQLPGLRAGAREELLKSEGLAEPLGVTNRQAYGDLLDEDSGLSPDAFLVARSGLGGFRYSDPYNCVVPDALHSIRLGLHLYFISLKLRSILSGLLLEQFPNDHQRAQALATLNTALEDISFLGSRVPNGALSYDKASGDEVDVLIKCLPVAMLAVTELDALQPALAEHLDWVALTEREEHDEEGLAEMLALGKRAQRSMNSFERFVELRTIKSYARHEFPEAARRFAAAVYTDTAAWEQTHGAAKQSGSFVNNHGGTDGQMLAHATRAEAAWRVVQDNRGRPGREMAAKRAQRNRTGCLPKSGGIGPVPLAGLLPDASHPALEALLQEFPTLAHLPFSVAAQQEQKGLLLGAQLVTVFRSAGLFYRKRVGGPSSGVMVHVGDDVAASNESDAVWIGRVEAFLSFKGHGNWAFVRWFEEAPQSQRTAPLGLMRLRWCYHERTVPGTSRRGQVPFYDLVQLSHVVEPVFVQEDRSLRGEASAHFFYNHRVR